MKRSLFAFIRLSVGVAILLVLFYRISLSKVINILLSVSPVVLLILPLVILPLFIGAANFKIFLTPIKGIAYLSLLKMYSFCWAIGMVFPGKIGEISVAYFLKEREGVPLGQGVAVFVLDNLVTLTNLAFLSMLGAVFLLKPVSLFNLLLIFLLMFAISLFFFTSSFGRTFLKKCILRRYASKFKGFYQTLLFFVTKRKRLLLVNLGITWLKFLCGIAIVYIIFASFNVYVPILIIIFISAISRIISLVPITVSGLGVREAVNVSLYALYGIPSSIVLTMCIIMLIVNYSLASVLSLTSNLQIIDPKL